MKKLQKLANILFIIGIALTMLCGCQIESEKVDGQELVEKARKNLATLNSGVITVTNNSSGKVEQMLTFRYDEVGIFTYALEGEDYVQFCNGYEIYTFENGQTTKLTKSDSGYQAYTKDVRYPMTDESYLYFDRENLSDVKKDGNVYTYAYEAWAISGDNSLGDLEDFKTVYAFDDSGEMLYFDQISRYNLKGNMKEYNYRIEIKQQNAVESVEKPEIFTVSE